MVMICCVCLVYELVTEVKKMKILNNDEYVTLPPRFFSNRASEVLLRPRNGRSNFKKIQKSTGGLTQGQTDYRCSKK